MLTEIGQYFWAIYYAELQSVMEKNQTEFCYNSRCVCGRWLIVEWQFENIRGCNHFVEKAKERWNRHNINVRIPNMVNKSFNKMCSIKDDLKSCWTCLVEIQRQFYKWWKTLTESCGDLAKENRIRMWPSFSPTFNHIYLSFVWFHSFSIFIT